MYVDTICIETSAGVGEIICELEEHSSPKEGKWVYYSENGKKQFEGNYSNNQKKGTWLFYDSVTGILIGRKEY